MNWFEPSPCVSSYVRNSPNDSGLNDTGIEAQRGGDAFRKRGDIGDVVAELGVALGEDLDDVAIDLDPVSVHLDLALQATHDRVVLEEVGHGLDRAEIVGRHEVDVRALLLHRPEEVAADAAEAVDPYANGHGMCCLPLIERCRR